jgi:hybrid cluster-associated redox disulfide protein
MKKRSGTDLQAEIEGMTIADLLVRWPDTAVVFHRHSMACVGCAVAPFYTVAEAAQVYNIPVAAFVDELAQLMK